MKWAAFAAAVGPVVLVLGKVVGAVGTVTGAMGKAFTAIGKFSAKVSMAGGGLGGFIKTLASSKLAMAALAAALVYGAIKLVDYASGAKAAREALEGMAKTAKSWKETEAETFYGKSQGLSFFGMTKDDFTRAVGNSKEWMSGLLAVWSDGKKETNEIVTEWMDSFKSLTASTRDELNSLKQTADQAGYASVSAQLQADIDTLDSMDKEIARLLKKKQNRKLSERDKVRLQELIDTREAIEVKYHLTAADTDGFDTIRNKVEAEVARADARGQEVSATVYENAMVAAAEGMSAVNSSLDEQYDKEYALIQLIENSTERQQALDALNARYNSDRWAAAMEYAQLMADVVMPVWQQSDIQTAKTQVGDLMQLLRQYSAASTDAEKKSFLPQLNQLTSSMDEGALTEYVGLLTQIQSLLDSGLSESEVQAMFPDIDFSSALEQLAAIQTYLNQNKWDTNLTSLNEMFGEAVGEEVLKITTDLDMSRFGRDYLHVGMYTEVKFPEAGIRFIAINDGVDSANGVSDDFTPFRNIINEWYCRDISKKIKASMQSRAKSGEHLTGNPPYGYRKDENDPKKWVIDEEPAKIIREIFQLYLDGRNATQISKEMKKRGYDAPGDYLAKRNQYTKGKAVSFETPTAIWHPGTILNILDRYEYCGHNNLCKPIADVILFVVEYNDVLQFPVVAHIGHVSIHDFAIAYCLSGFSRSRKKTQPYRGTARLSDADIGKPDKQYA